MREELIWQLSAQIDRPDLTILLDGDPHLSRVRATQRGTHSRFHGELSDEAERYRALVTILNHANYPTRRYDIGEQEADEVAAALHNIFDSWHRLSYAGAEAD